MDTPQPFGFQCICSPPSFCLESHHLCVTSLTSSQTKLCGSTSQHPSTLLGTLVHMFITSLITEVPTVTWPCLPLQSGGSLEERRTFWFIFSSPSRISWFLAHREHSNIYWKITFQRILAKWVNHHPMMSILCKLWFSHPGFSQKIRKIRGMPTYQHLILHLHCS